MYSNSLLRCGSKFYWWCVTYGILVLSFCPEVTINSNILNMDYGDSRSLETDSVTYLLYTKKNPESGISLFTDDTDNLSYSGISYHAPLKIIIHGYNGMVRDGFATKMKNAYMKSKGNVNVIIVDWKELAHVFNYIEAVINTQTVGKSLAKLISFLLRSNVTSRHNIHIIGHSLGAYCGSVACNILAPIEGKIGRLTGLDPAQPFRQYVSKEFRFNVTNALFVDVIHTSLLGIYHEAGHVDFYPNYGTHQPHCDIGDLECNHGASYQFYIESIYNPRAFKAFHCRRVSIKDGVPNFQHAACHTSSREGIVYMGEHVDTKSRGIYFLTTIGFKPKPRNGDLGRSHSSHIRYPHFPTPFME